MDIMSYSDQTHCESLDKVGQYEIAQAGYLMIHTIDYVFLSHAETS